MKLIKTMTFSLWHACVAFQPCMQCPVDSTLLLWFLDSGALYALNNMPVLFAFWNLALQPACIPMPAWADFWTVLGTFFYPHQHSQHLPPFYPPPQGGWERDERRSGLSLAAFSLLSSSGETGLGKMGRNLLLLRTPLYNLSLSLLF